MKSMILTDEQKALIRGVLSEMMEPTETMITRGIQKSAELPITSVGPVSRRSEMRHTFREMVSTFAAENGIYLPRME